MSAEIDEANRKSIVVLSVSALLIFGVRLCLTYSRVPHTNKVVFMIAIILFALLAGINQLVKKNTYIIHASVYLFMAIYVGVGIVSAVGEGSLTERTILYLAFVSVVPLLFALNAVELVAVIVSEEILYLYLIGKYQSAYPVYTTNVGNSFFLSVTGLGLGIYLANRKFSGIYNAHMTARMEEVEQLNRELAATHIDNKEQVKDYLGKIMISSQQLPVSRSLP